MARAAKTRNGGRWTECRLFGELRSMLRKFSMRSWKPLQDLMKQGRRPSQNKARPQLKWEHQCAMCGGWFAGDEIERDHVEPCGSLRSFEELGDFTRRLLVEVDGLQKLCGECHKSRKGEA